MTSCVPATAFRDRIGGCVRDNPDPAPLAGNDELRFRRSDRTFLRAENDGAVPTTE